MNIEKSDAYIMLRSFLNKILIKAANMDRRSRKREIRCQQ